MCRGLLALASALLGLVLPGSMTRAEIVEAPRPAEPITIGASHTMTTHGAERQVNVLLPTDYATSDKTYPLVVMLDGGRSQDLFLQFGIHRWIQLWGRSEEAIIVGIETVDRQRELLPPTRNAREAERYPSAGEAHAFREWLAEEVLPLVRRTYRHDGRAVLIGESAAGHFVAETWLKSPWLFNGYAALSPSLQWDEQSLSHDPLVAEAKDRPPLFLSLADEGGDTEEGVLRFVKSAEPGLCFADRRASHVRHANALHRLLPQALQFLLPTKADWLNEFGFTVDCTQSQGIQN